MRIAHVTATFPPYLGGTGTVVYHHAEELAGRGHHVCVLTAAASGLPPADPPGVDVQRLAVRLRSGNAPLLAGLAGALRGAELVHLHYPFYFGAETVWWHCRRAGVPYVITYHQDVLLRFPLSLIVDVHHQLLGRRILDDAAVVAATTLDYVAGSRLAGVPRQRITAIPNGVDARIYRPGLDASAIRARHLLAPDQQTVLFVGGLDAPHYFKGLAVLLEAIARVPEALLLVVGEGALRGTYEQLAHDLGAADRVQFAGRVSPEDLPLYYTLADVTVLPSVTRGEAFGLVLVEAMACGRPVVASSLAGVRTVVRDGQNGFLVEPGDADDLAAKIRTLLSEPNLASRFGATGRQIVEQCYTWQRVADQWEQTYEQVLDQPGSRIREAVAW